MGVLVDEEKQRGVALSEMQTAMKAVMETLSVDQRKMFDGRMAQAVPEPLGS